MNFFSKLIGAIVPTIIILIQPQFTIAQLSSQQVKASARKITASSEPRYRSENIADLNAEFSFNYSDANDYLKRGISRYEQGDKEGAIADFNEAIRLNPNYAQAYGNRGNIREYQGDKQGAINDFQKAADLFQQQGNSKGYKLATDRLGKLKQ